MSGAPAKDKKNKAKGILTDVTKCIGCERCVEACVRKNKLPLDLPAHFKAKDGLSGKRYTSIVKLEAKKRTDEGKRQWRMVRRQCMHCVDPACANACLVGAFTKRGDGAVKYDADKCIGCRYCMIACPFMIPRYEFDETLPYVRKCKMDETCRVEGGMPACTSACPTDATIFGPRDELIKEAKRRITNNPERYINHLYGEHEFGGTSVMYLSDVPLSEPLRMPTKEQFEKLAVPSLAHASIPSLLHDWVLVTPFQFITGAAGLAGIWFLRRRTKVMNERAQERGKTDPNEGGA